MPDSAWKKTEREHARLFGAKEGRTGPTGLDLPDWLTHIIAGESKHTKDHLPLWLEEAVIQSVENCERYEGMNELDHPMIPLVVFHVAGESRATDDLVVMRTAEFLHLVLPAINFFYEHGGYAGEGVDRLAKVPWLVPGTGVPKGKA